MGVCFHGKSLFLLITNIGLGSLQIEVLADKFLSVFCVCVCACMCLHAREL